MVNTLEVDKIADTIFVAIQLTRCCSQKAFCYKTVLLLSSQNVYQSYKVTSLHALLKLKDLKHKVLQKVHGPFPDSLFSFKSKSVHD